MPRMPISCEGSEGGITARPRMPQMPREEVQMYSYGPASKQKVKMRNYNAPWWRIDERYTSIVSILVAARGLLLLLTDPAFVPPG